jgi:hypothetical protein
MVLLRELTEGALDLGVVGGLGYAEDLIGVEHRAAR